MRAFASSSVHAPPEPARPIANWLLTRGIEMLGFSVVFVTVAWMTDRASFDPIYNLKILGALAWVFYGVALFAPVSLLLTLLLKEKTRLLIVLGPIGLAIYSYCVVSVGHNGALGIHSADISLHIWAPWISALLLRVALSFTARIPAL